MWSFEPSKNFWVPVRREQKNKWKSKKRNFPFFLFSFFSFFFLFFFFFFFRFEFGTEFGNWNWNWKQETGNTTQIFLSFFLSENTPFWNRTLVCLGTELGWIVYLSELLGWNEMFAPRISRNGSEKGLWKKKEKKKKMPTHCCLLKEFFGHGPAVQFVEQSQELEEKENKIAQLEQTLHKTRAELAILKKEQEVHNQILSSKLWRIFAPKHPMQFPGLTALLHRLRFPPFLQRSTFHLWLLCRKWPSPWKSARMKWKVKIRRWISPRFLHPLNHSSTSKQQKLPAWCRQRDLGQKLAIHSTYRSSSSSSFSFSFSFSFSLSSISSSSLSMSHEGRGSPVGSFFSSISKYFSRSDSERSVTSFGILKSQVLHLLLSSGNVSNNGSKIGLGHHKARLWTAWNLAPK